MTSSRLTRIAVTSILISLVASTFIVLSAVSADAAKPRTSTGELCTIVGTKKSNVLTGTTGDDVICGLGGNDTIEGGGGNDTIDGGAGNDTVEGGSGDDEIYGSSGNDDLYGEEDNDFIDAGSGTDDAVGGDGDDGLIGGSGVDDLNGDGGYSSDPENNLCDPTADGDVVSYCGFDENAPDITSISVSSPTVDTHLSAQDVVISATVTDELMGIAVVWCGFSQSGAADLFQGEFVSGTIREGNWTCTVPLPKWSSPGDWFVNVSVTDYTGKQLQVIGQANSTFRYWKEGEMPVYVDELGDVAVEQIGAGDETSPEISDIQVDRNSVDTSSVAQKVVISALVVDDLSGAKSAWCGLRQAGTGDLFQGSRATGTILNGRWNCTVVLPKWAAPGTWTVEFGSQDFTGKQTAVRAISDGTFEYLEEGESTVTRSDLGVSSITQSGDGDSESPDADDIQVSRSTVNTSSKAQKITISTHITDDLSGVKHFACGLSHGGAPDFFNGKLSSGSITDGVAKCTVTLPRGSARGVWLINLAILDKSGKQTEVRAKSDGSFEYWKAGHSIETVTGLGAFKVVNG